MPGRLRRLTVYETPGRFYIVGCDSTATKYNLLKIDRTDSKVLLTGEPENDYSRSDILELLATVAEGSSIVYQSSSGKKSGAKKSSGLVERVSNAFGLLGVVRFTEGFYLIIVTKAIVVATIGYHAIYKIAECAMVSIAADGEPTSSEEQRYVKLFQSVDLSTDFYFSYTYDLSRSLQENVLNCDWGRDGERTANVDARFIWNKFLLGSLRGNLVSERWMLEVVHGFVGQQHIELPCSRLQLTLIGRRSAEYAGTRFLKRGANHKGDVANDVETEQIVWDSSSSPHLARGRFTAFCQRRGSVPLRWSQDPATRGVVGKPLILIDINEPHAQTAASHFRHLRKKYGSPIVVMNLVKRREKRRHEAVLHDQFLKAVNYLNQFLPPKEHIAYLSLDVARCNKTSNVLTKFDEIGFKVIQRHGWFQTFPPVFSHELCPSALLPNYKPLISEDGRFILQTGISRTNCVDCLDRTNVAQFGVGKVALGCQLWALGVLAEPSLSLQGEVCRAYEDLMDQHGDTLAWQYAGSQLVHSIKTYKKTSAFQERSRDVIGTLSRYYSNTFGDYDKQAAINLFLGVYRPQFSGATPLWDLQTDYYLHFPIDFKLKTDYCAWMLDEREIEDFVFIGMEDEKEKEESGEDESRNTGSRSAYGPLVMRDADDFRDFYRTFELSNMDVLVKRQATIEAKTISLEGVNQEIGQGGQFMKLFRTQSDTPPAPPSAKVSSTSKNQKDEDEDEDDDDDAEQKSEVEVEYEPSFYSGIERAHSPSKEKALEKHKEQRAMCALARGLRDLPTTYEGPTETDRKKYEDYVRMVEFNCDPKLKPKRLLGGTEDDVFEQARKKTFFTRDSAFQTEIPEVSKASLKLYTASLEPSLHEPTKADTVVFATYPGRIRAF